MRAATNSHRRKPWWRTTDGGEGLSSLLQRRWVRARAGEDESPAPTLMGGRWMGCGVGMGNFWIENGFSLELRAFYWRLRSSYKLSCFLVFSLENLQSSYETNVVVRLRFPLASVYFPSGTGLPPCYYKISTGACQTVSGNGASTPTSSIDIPKLIFLIHSNI
jgi:hypothetical protein